MTELDGPAGLEYYDYLRGADSEAGAVAMYRAWLRGLTPGTIYWKARPTFRQVVGSPWSLWTARWNCAVVLDVVK